MSKPRKQKTIFRTYDEYKRALFPDDEESTRLAENDPYQYGVQLADKSFRRIGKRHARQ